MWFISNYVDFYLCIVVLSHELYSKILLINVKRHWNYEQKLILIFIKGSDKLWRGSEWWFSKLNNCFYALWFLVKSWMSVWTLWSYNCGDVIWYMMQSYPARALDRRLQVDCARDPREGPRVLMSLRVDFEPMG